MKNVRVFFKKTGKLKYISHLDLNRCMLRFMRMANMPIWYTEGYHPRPYIVLTAPLPLGFESEWEALDLRLNQDLSLQEVEDRLRAVFPIGLEVIRAAEPVHKIGDIAWSQYEILADFGDGVSEFLESNPLTVQKKTKKGTFKEISVQDNMPSYVLEGNRLLVTLTTSNNGSVNPNMLLEALERELGRNIPVFSVKRTMLLTHQMEPFC